MKWSRHDWLAVAVCALGVALVSAERPGLAARHGQLVSGRDGYLLPPAQQTVVMSLGYRAALADLIFGHVLVSVGLHLADKRLFEFAGGYIETINELDPKFREPYRYADAILTLQTVKVPEEMFRQARAIMLRGTRELPYDQELWSTAGQYLAYLAPGGLSDPQEIAAFKQEGARLLAHACELIGSNDNIPYHCVTAALLYSEAGNRAASQAFLERFLLVVDDPEIRKLAQGQLDLLAGPDAKRESGLRQQRLLQIWRDDLPFVSRSALGALGPPFDAARCAGRQQAGSEPCTTSLRERLAPRGSAP